MSQGKVYLVGAGPGDPGLLTLRGRQILASADLVLYDGLVNPLLLNLTEAPCERTARTRTLGSRVVPQEEINARLIHEAQQGKVVARLKGGDPFIFGRGGEEVAALEAAGIPYEVVPGVTAATAAGEYAGFSFTHRELSSAVAFVTGHEDPAKSDSSLDYQALAAFSGTLIFYMGLGRIAEICQRLVANGLPAGTPAAVICRASLPTQQVVSATLKDLPGQVERAELKPPSLIVVGDCVSQRQAASWFERRPLFGQRIGVCRAKHQFAEVAEKIVALSGQPVCMPLIETELVSGSRRATAEQRVSDLSDVDWLVFTSVNGVDAFFELLWSTAMDSRQLYRAKIAAIGSATADALERYALRADLVPESFRAEELGTALAPHVDGRRVLWPRASRGRDVLLHRLSDAGAVVEELVVYRNDDVSLADPETIQVIRENQLDWIALSSPSIARQAARLLNEQQVDIQKAGIRIASISPVTSAAARDAGLMPEVEARTSTWDGLLAAIAGDDGLNPEHGQPGI